MRSIKIKAPSDLEEGKIITAFDGTAMVNVCVPHDVKKGKSFHACVVGPTNESTSIPMGGQDDAKVESTSIPMGGQDDAKVVESTSIPMGGQDDAKVVESTSIPMGGQDDVKVVTAKPYSSIQAYPNTVSASSNSAQPRSSAPQPSRRGTGGNARVDIAADVNKNCLANVSLVMGCVGIFIFGIILGPLAIIFASIVHCNPDKHSGQGKATAGLVLGIVDIVIWAVIVALYF